MSLLVICFSWQIYATNAVESVYAQLRKFIKTRGHFLNDEAATQQIWQALRNIRADRARAARTEKQ